MNARERTAHGVVVACLDLLVSGDAIWLEVAPAVVSSMERFRPRCPACAAVLTVSPWVEGVRSWSCRCGWSSREALLV